MLEARIGTGEYSAKLKGYKREAHYLLSPRHTILVKPYAKAAAELRFNLFAKDFPYDVWKLGTYVGVSEAYKVSNGFVPFHQLSQREQKERISTFPSFIEETIAKSDEERNASENDKFWNEVDKLKV
jgi:hypothetical protein